MTREETLKSNYMKLDGACDEDWQEGSKDEMYQCILDFMSEFAQQEVSDATHPLQQKIDGLREALKELQEVSKHYSLMQDIIKQDLETYK